MDPMSQNPPMLAQIRCPSFYDDGHLVPFEAPELNDVEESVLGENQLLDPERPSSR